MAREINLVPDIKNEMIKALKLRNLIFFLSLIVAIASVSITAITAIIMGGQQIAIDGKKGTIDNLSSKLNSYKDLKDFLTIRDQLSDINNLTDNKKVLSRTFNILSALIPTGSDTITISELNVDLAAAEPTFSFDAQANAGQEPFIDYNVLDAFKKSMDFMRYDYGSYVDNNGEKIPAYCMIESAIDGSYFNDPDRGRYAYWTINAEGCEPNKTASGEELNNESGVLLPSSDNRIAGYETEDYETQRVVRVWRTPQFNEWYSGNNNSKITLDGQISDVAHFESECISYNGYENQNVSPTQDETILAKTGGVTWVASNSTCRLTTGEDSGISIYDSSNGRGEDGELVLRFSSTITFDPKVFDFNNSHMIAIAPSSRRNVTDSYVQIQAMFGERAADCDPGDATCSNTQNSGQNSNNSGSNTNTNNSSNSGNNTNSDTNNSNDSNSSERNRNG